MSDGVVLVEKNIRHNILRDSEAEHCAAHPMTDKECPNSCINFGTLEDMCPSIRRSECSPTVNHPLIKRLPPTEESHFFDTRYDKNVLKDDPNLLAIFSINRCRSFTTSSDQVPRCSPTAPYSIATRKHGTIFRSDCEDLPGLPHRVSVVKDSQQGAFDVAPAATDTCMSALEAFKSHERRGMVSSYYFVTTYWVSLSCITS
jgi:hypothetical protein